MLFKDSISISSLNNVNFGNATFNKGFNMKNSDVIVLEQISPEKLNKLMEFMYNANIRHSVGLTKQQAYDIISEIEEDEWQSSTSWDDSGCSEY